MNLRKCFALTEDHTHRELDANQFLIVARQCYGLTLTD